MDGFVGAILGFVIGFLVGGTIVLGTLRDELNGGMVTMSGKAWRVEEMRP